RHTPHTRRAFQVLPNFLSELFHCCRHCSAVLCCRHIDGGRADVVGSVALMRSVPSAPDGFAPQDEEFQRCAEAAGFATHCGPIQRKQFDAATENRQTFDHGPRMGGPMTDRATARMPKEVPKRMPKPMLRAPRALAPLLNGVATNLLATLIAGIIAG